MKYLLAVIVMLCSAMGHSQTDSVSKWRFGVSVAPSLSYRIMMKMDGPFFPNQAEFIDNARQTDHAGLGYHASIVVEKRTKNIGFSIGARYTRTNFTREEDFTIVLTDPNDPVFPFESGQTVSWTSSFETVSVGLPLAFRYYKNLTNKALVFGAGINNQFLLYQHSVSKFDDFVLYDSKQHAGSVQYFPMVQLNIGIESALGDRLKLLVEPFFKVNARQMHLSSGTNEFLYDAGVSLTLMMR